MKKKEMEILEIIRAHKCENCTAVYKKHLLGHWLEIINHMLPPSKRLSSKCLSKIFKTLRPEGTYQERFLLGKGSAKIKDNFYIYIGKEMEK